MYIYALVGVFCADVIPVDCDGVSVISLMILSLVYKKGNK